MKQSATSICGNFTYDPDSGVVCKRGVSVTSKHSNGKYLTVSFCGVKYYVHRLAWFLHYGTWPTGSIDHVNGDGLDNRIENLRCVSHSDNMRNRKKHTRKHDLPFGITSRTSESAGTRYRAQVGVNGRCVHSKTFCNLDEAIAAREEMLKQHGYHSNHGRDVTLN